MDLWMTSFSDDTMRAAELGLHHLCLVLEIGAQLLMLVTLIKQQLFSSGRQGDQWSLNSFA